MKNRIEIQTPSGSVYLGEGCERQVTLPTGVSTWSPVIFDALRISGGEMQLSWGSHSSWHTLDCIRPAQPKKMRPMDVADIVLSHFLRSYGTQARSRGIEMTRQEYEIAEREKQVKKYISRCDIIDEAMFFTCMVLLASGLVIVAAWFFTTVGF